MRDGEKKSLWDDSGALSISVWNNTAVHVDTHTCMWMNHPHLRASRKVAKCKKANARPRRLPSVGVPFFCFFFSVVFMLHRDGIETDVQRQPAQTGLNTVKAPIQEATFPFPFVQSAHSPRWDLCICLRFSGAWSAYLVSKQNDPVQVL